MNLMQNNLSYIKKPLVVEYSFKIRGYEFFYSRQSQRFLRIIFDVFNENESFDTEQIFMIYDDGTIHQSYYDFVNQFRAFGDVIDDVHPEDLINEQGTCYFEYRYSNGKTYQKIILTSWKDGDM